LRETLTGFLRQKQMLLLLDNFEHVIDAASDIAGLLAECPRLSFAGDEPRSAEPAR